MSGIPNMKSMSAVVPLRIASRQPEQRAEVASPRASSRRRSGRISVSTQGSRYISSPMPLTRFWNRWLCVLISPGSSEHARARRSSARRSRAARSAARPDPARSAGSRRRARCPARCRYCSSRTPPRTAVAFVMRRSKAWSPRNPVPSEPVVAVSVIRCRPSPKR